ncbi:DUF2510 domain-containing protein [Rhodococcus qingshengii]|uniref:DUF2510 domain-containing protein n=1 Tax=Rhodococcus qingshengii TaxID=334542 RepID=UPI0036F9E48B
MNSQPGWYPDPQNPAAMRYWDGNQWTPHSQPGQPIPFGGQPQKKKGKVLIPILAVLGGLIVIIVGLSIVTSPSSTTKNIASETTPPKIEPNLADASTYKEVDERELALILKDMRAHAGQRIILYGTVAQFDSATGPGQFLADVGTSALGIGNYESAHMVGDPATLKPFVRDDEVKMFVVVDGEYSYTSTADYKLTVPQFKIGIIEMAGS